MTIVIVTSRDPRQRYLFLSNPLEELGHTVIVCKSISSLMLTIVRINFNVDIFLCVGVGMPAVLAQCVHTALRARFVVRIGGDTVGDIKSQIDARNEKGDSVFRDKIRLHVAKFVFSKTKELIVVSNCINEKLRPFLSPQCRTFVISQHVRGEKTAYIPSAPVTEKLNILTVTNLLFKEKAEGVIRIIDALEKIVDLDAENTLPAIEFIVAGDGIERAHVDKRVSLITDDRRLRVTMLGRVSDVNRLYSQADVFLYSSTRDAVPNVLLEARRNSLLCVLFACYLDPEVFTDGKEGLRASDYTELRDILYAVSSNEERLNLLVRNSLNLLWLRYSHSAIKANINNWLENVNSESYS